MSIEAQLWAKKQRVNNPGAKFLLWVLADYADAAGASCFPTIESLCSDTEQGERTVSRHLDHLEASGFISRFRPRLSDGTLGRYNYRLKLDAKAPPANLAAGEPPANLAKTTCQFGSSIKPSIKPPEKEKKALTREAFLREIDKGYQESAFEQWPHLTETEIKQAAVACLDFYGAKGEWPGGEPVVVLCHWIRGGIKKKAIRSAPVEPKEGRASGGNPVTAPSHDPATPKIAEHIDPTDADTWTKVCRSIDINKFRAWLSQCELRGIGGGRITLGAPSPFVSDYVRQHFALELAQLWTAFTGAAVSVGVVHCPDLSPAQAQTPTAKEPAHA